MIPVVVVAVVVVGVVMVVAVMVVVVSMVVMSVVEGVVVIIGVGVASRLVVLSLEVVAAAVIVALAATHLGAAGTSVSVEWVRTLAAALQEGVVRAEAAPLSIAPAGGAASRLASSRGGRRTEPVVSLGFPTAAGLGLRAATLLYIPAPAGTLSRRPAITARAGAEPMAFPARTATARPWAEPRWSTAVRRAVAHLSAVAAAAAALLSARPWAATVTEPVTAATRGDGALFPFASLAATSAATVAGVWGAAAQPRGAAGAVAYPWRPAGTVALSSTASLLTSSWAVAEPMVTHSVRPRVTSAAAAAQGLGAVAVTVPLATAAATSGTRTLRTPPLGVAVSLRVACCGGASVCGCCSAVKAVATPS